MRRTARAVGASRENDETYHGHAHPRKSIRSCSLSAVPLAGATLTAVWPPEARGSGGNKVGFLRDPTLRNGAHAAARVGRRVCEGSCAVMLTS